MAFWGKKKEDVSEFTKLRTKQIEAFEQYNPTAKPLNPQKTAFHVPVSTQYGQLVFQVTLEPMFPERPPILQVLQRVQHRWIDKDMLIVGHAKLGSNWSAHHHLGQIVRDVYAEFARNPPTPLTAAAAGGGAAAAAPQPSPTPTPLPPAGAGAAGAPGGGPPGGMPHMMPGHPHMASPYPAGSPYTPGGVAPGGPSLPHGIGGALPDPLGVFPRGGPAAGGGEGERPPLTPSSSFPPPGSGPSGAPTPAPGQRRGSEQKVQTRIPEVPTQFLQLDKLTISQLEELNARDGFSLQDMIDNMDAVQNMVSVRDDLLNAVDDIAKKNLARRETLRAVEAELTTTRAKVIEKQAQLASLAARQQAVQQKYSLKNLITALDSSIEEAEEASDKLKDKYQSQDGDEDDDGKEKEKDGSDDEEEKGGGGGGGGGGRAAAAAKLSHAKFCEQFVKLRTIAHMRMARKERLIEIYGRPA